MIDAVDSRGDQLSICRVSDNDPAPKRFPHPSFGFRARQRGYLHAFSRPDFGNSAPDEPQSDDERFILIAAEQPWQMSKKAQVNLRPPA